MPAVFWSHPILLYLLSVQFIKPLSCEISLQGIATDMFDLLSYDQDASCEQYQPYLCGQQYTPVMSHEQEGADRCKTELTCPASSYNSSCLIDSYIPPNVTYQFVHTQAGDESFMYRFSWEELPDNCNVEYYLAIFSENEPSTDTCDGYKDISHCFPFIINNEQREIYITFKGFLQTFVHNDDKLVRYFKLIAYPVYEWPTIAFQTPGYCPEENNQNIMFPNNAIGCQTCNGGCTGDITPPQNFKVSYNFTSDSMLANVSWTISNSVIRYYLHVNSSEGHSLYWLHSTVSLVTVSGLVADEQYEMWLEQYSCGCSGTTDKHVIQQQQQIDNKDYSFQLPSIDSVDSSTTPDPINYTPTHTTITVHATSDPITAHTASDPITAHTASDLTTHTTSDSVAHDYLDPSSSSVVSPTNKTRAMPYIISSSVIIVVLIVVAIVFVISAIVIRKRGVLRKCSCYYNPKPVVQPQPLNNGPRNNDSPTRVMLIHSMETKEKKLLEILTFLDHDLGSLYDENGSKLFDICRYDISTERNHPSEWLDKHYKSCDYIICVVGKKFKREWNNETRPDAPLVYAFNQLFNSSFSTSSNPLHKIVIVLRNKLQDEKHIPSQYLQGRKRFNMDDTDGLASYMLGRPRHLFIGENAV